MGGLIGTKLILIRQLIIIKIFFFLEREMGCEDIGVVMWTFGQTEKVELCVWDYVRGVAAFG